MCIFFIYFYSFIVYILFFFFSLVLFLPTSYILSPAMPTRVSLFRMALCYDAHDNKTLRLVTDLTFDFDFDTVVGDLFIGNTYVIDKSHNF